MKKQILSALSVATVTLMMAQEQSFTISGNIPGLKANDKVELVNRDVKDGSEWSRLPAASVTDGKFVISGSVAMPLMCEVRIDRASSETPIGYIFELMVENLPIEVDAVQIDSLPPSFYTGTVGIDRRKNVTVKGGEAQREFEEMRAATQPCERALRQAHYNSFWDENRDRSKEGKKRLSEAYSAAQLDLAQATEAFIRQHPTYHVSAIEWGQVLAEPFQFTAQELDTLQSQLGANNSPVRVAKLNAAIETARKFVRGQRFTDFVAKDPQGADHSISEYAGKGAWTMVDFWASWCGPCRAAIPHVRELHEKYGDRLGIYAVSLDEDDDAWRKAMEQEKMTWPQLQMAKENFSNVSRDYNFKAIPFMVLIDPEGRIAFAGHDPVKVASILADGLGD